MVLNNERPHQHLEVPLYLAKPAPRLVSAGPNPSGTSDVADAAPSSLRSELATRPNLFEKCDHRTPCGLYVDSAAFAAAYAVVDSGSGSSCWIDVRWTITPDLRASIDGSSARSSRTAAIKFRSISVLHASSSSAASPPPGASEPPRTLTTMSMPPR